MTFRVVVIRVQMSTYYKIADSYKEAEITAIQEAESDDWSNDFAIYKTLSSQMEELPFE